MQILEKVATFLNDILWSNPLIILCFALGLFFTIGLKFVQFRRIKDMVRLLLKGKSSKEGLTSFQAFSLAISGRVGTGAIAGVATAIAFGGPGAMFWMWVLGLLGAATTFVECTLAQAYKQDIGGQYRGGSAYYIAGKFRSKALGAIYAVAITFASAVCLTGIQANSISSAVYNAVHLDKKIMGIIIIVLLGLIIFGGVKRLGKSAELIIPFMCCAYVIVAVIVLLFNAAKIPSMFGLIFSSAFGAKEMFAGIIGSAIAMGCKRGVYSSEAGMGTATQSAAAAEVSHPAKQGLVQAFSIYIDILFICTATGLMILVTDSYNVLDAAGNAIVSHVGDIEAGPIYTQLAVDSVLPFGSIFVAVALFFFAFTTLMSMYYNCETNLAYFFKNGIPKVVTNILRVIYLICTYYGAVATADAAWAFGDVGIGLITWVNLISLIFLSGTAFKLLKDYENQMKQGLDPIFEPEKHGFTGMDLWTKISKKYKAEASREASV